MFLTKYYKVAYATILGLVIFLGFSYTKVEAARFSLSPANQQFTQTCEYTIDINIDTEGKVSNAADIEVLYNPAQIEVVDANPSISGTQVGTGEAYEAYFGNQVDNSIGRLRLAGGSFSSTVNGTARFGYIRFKSKPSVNAANFTIKFDGAGNTLDSNIAENSTSLDILSSVGNGSYTFAAGTCVVDTTPPVINFTNPQNGQANVPVNQTVTIQLTDDLSGVDLDTLQIDINGQTFTPASDGVTITGSPLNYTVVIDGSKHPGFPIDEVSTVSVDVSDVAGNARSSSISFNRADPPVINFVNPENNDLNVESNRTIVVEVSDDGSGVDINTVQVIINGEIFGVGSSGFSYTGTPAKYTITIDGNAHAGINPNQTNTIRVEADDLKGNGSTSTILVNQPPIPDSIKPIIQFVQPVDTFDEFDTNKPIIIKVYDYQSGVNIDLLEIYINGQLFTINTSGVTYSGNPTEYTITITGYKDILQNNINSLRVVAYDFAGNVREAVLGLGICIDSGEVNFGEDDSDICIGGSIDIPEDSFISAYIDEVGPNGFAATMSLLGFFLTLLPFLSLLNAPALLINILSFIFGRKSRTEKAWGMVYDRNTLKPIALATIRLYTAGTTNLAGQWISDMHGRYGLVVPKGNYRMEVVHPDYVRFQTDVVIQEEGANISMNIPMSTTENYDMDVQSRLRAIWIKVKNFLKKLSPIIFILGFILAIIAVIYNLNLINALILGFYAVIAALYYVYHQRTRRYSVVIDSETGYRVPAAAIKVYHPETMEVVETQVTNSLGQFDYFGEPGEYLLLVAGWGYNFPSMKQKDYPVIDKGVASFVKVNLKTGRNRLKLLVDPRQGNEMIEQMKPKFGAI